MENKKVFITGATGLLGSHIVDILIERGYECVALYRSKPGRLQKVHWIQGDLLSPSTYESALRGIDIIIHAASLISYQKKDRKKLFQTNYLATRDLVNTALNLGVDTLIYISSASTRVRSSEPFKISLQTKGNPVFYSNYSQSKFLAELEVWRAEAEGMKTSIIHPSLLIGHGDWSKGSMKIFERVFSGLSHYPPGHLGIVGAEDVARFICDLCKKDESGTSYILNAEVWTYKEFLNKIASALNKPQINKEARYWMAYLIKLRDTILSSLKNQPSLVTRETLNSSFQKFSFEPSSVHLYPYSDMNTLIKECAKRQVQMVTHEE
jgi:dihydroflavonol-4-reductase